MLEEEFEIEEFANNPSPRLPIALVLDTSASMSGEPIEELNEALKLFVDEIYNDEIARHSAEICVITFGGLVRVVQDFTTVDRIELEELIADGNTPMGSAVLVALERLEERKNLYKELGIDYYQPWLVLMTDGMPTDSITGAAARVQELLDQKRLVVFPIAIGPNASISVLEKFTTPNRRPLRMKEHGFKEFFMWLSKSVASASRSVPGEGFKLADGLEGWAKID
ncbi:vWA domain-containing protein [Archaeoglobus neptunius]|uniref:vWA domain-containing protein n=1 Tax=Archaeoglobus neptunius TaxID=2798580 RepID=UPI001928D5F4